MSIRRYVAMHPTNIQLEVTYKCNNACPFCYNELDASCNRDGDLLSFERLKNVIKDIKDYGIFSINLNGGEPLCYPYFFDLLEFIKQNNLDVHCNSNATLVDAKTAKRLSKSLASMCTSIHGYCAQQHDKLVNRFGAFDQTIAGIKFLQEENIYVAVNVTVSKLNISNLNQICNLLKSLNIRTLLLTRILTPSNLFSVSDNDFLNAVRIIKDFNEMHQCFGRIALPQPFPVCRCSDDELKKYIAEHNIACAAGILTARIAPNGNVTPCPVIESPVLGNVNSENFSDIWNRFQKTKWQKKMPKSCCNCQFLQNCGGGCLAQDDSGILI